MNNEPWLKCLYFGAKFHLLWMIANPPPSQSWGRKTLLDSPYKFMSQFLILKNNRYLFLPINKLIRVVDFGNFWVELIHESLLNFYLFL